MIHFVAPTRRMFALGLGGTFLLGLNSPMSAQSDAVDISTIVEMTQGAEDAPVIVIEYASFTCPFCARFHAGPYQQLKKDYINTGKVKLIYRDVFTDRYGLWASMIARCAGPDGFFRVTDMIYAAQPIWSQAGDASSVADELRKVGWAAGMTSETLEACLQDADKAQALVVLAQQNVAQDAIDVTPSFIINAKPVANQPYEGLQAIIETELGN